VQRKHIKTLTFEEITFVNCGNLYKLVRYMPSLPCYTGHDAKFLAKLFSIKIFYSSTILVYHKWKISRILMETKCISNGCKETKYIMYYSKRGSSQRTRRKVNCNSRNSALFGAVKENDLAYNKSNRAPRCRIIMGL
jgi:hypothetical protein